jgi:hypothetical protein
MAINFTTFMNRAGKLMKAADVLQTARNTTIPDEVEDAVQIVDSASMEIQDTFRGLPQASTSWQSAGSSLLSSLTTAFQDLLVRTVKDDNPQEANDIDDSLIEFVNQLEDAGGKVDANTIGATVSSIGSPTGSGAFVTSTKRGDGRINEHSLAEDISGEVTSDSSTGSESIQFRGEESIDETSVDWPGGSGTSRTITAANAAGSGNLLTNGNMETENSSATNLPDGWIVSVGTLGTDLIMTTVEVQTYSLGGAPTAGYYLLHWVNSGSDSQTTVPIAYNATASTVQSALRSFDELGAVTVASSGTAPNLTFTITFTGVTNPAQLTSTDNMTTSTVNEVQTLTITGASSGNFTLTYDDTGSNPRTTSTIAYNASAATVESTFEALSNVGSGNGTCDGGALNSSPSSPVTITFTGTLAATNVNQVTITADSTDGTSTLVTTTEGTGIVHDTSTAGDDDVLLGARSLQVVGVVGATLPAIQQRITGLKDRTNYAVCVWMKLDASATPTGGVLAVELIDGIGGSVIADEQSVSNTFSTTTTTAGDLATGSWTARTGVFRLPRVVNDVVYLRLRYATTLTDTKKMYIDHVAMVEMTEMYAGGPYLAAFSGATPWQNGDKYNLAVTNNRAGSIHEYFDRWADLRGKGLLLPIAGGGTLYGDSSHIT